MGAKKSSVTPDPVRKRRPAISPEARENQMVSYAIDLVEQRLLNGTASSQETTHFLKIGSIKGQLEKEILKKEKELIEAKTQALKSQQKVEELYANALNAMRRYSGQDDLDDEED